MRKRNVIRVLYSLAQRFDDSKLKVLKFRLGVKCKFSIVWLIILWKKLLRVMVSVPAVESFQSRLDVSLKDKLYFSHSY